MSMLSLHVRPSAWKQCDVVGKCQIFEIGVEVSSYSISFFFDNSSHYPVKYNDENKSWQHTTLLNACGDFKPIWDASFTDDCTFIVVVPAPNNAYKLFWLPWPRSICQILSPARQPCLPFNTPFNDVMRTSVVPRPFLNPACSGLSFSSTSVISLSMRIVPSSLLSVGKTETPLELSQIARLPSFAMIEIRLFF